MGRFDRDDSKIKIDSETFALVTEELRSTVERQLREVVDEGMARAEPVRGATETRFQSSDAAEACFAAARVVNS
jgi:hypothetical protein